MSNYRKLQTAKHCLTLISAGVNITKIKVSEVASEVGAPANNWTAKNLLKWVDEKMFLMSLKPN